MTDKACETSRAALSRRSMMRRVVFAAGAAALGTHFDGSHPAKAQTKVAQQVVGYQDTPHDAQRCDNCLQFQPPDACKVVEGKISPSGWCKVYVRKPA